ncbi:hypothetical protein CNEONATNEC32_03255 [Clostridium neonatale]|nr:hypothetical protein [Clostridium neonatale]SUQ50639.1 hypothetical protein CNEONATNEC32_03255 [Clostridium neonatale]
MKVDINKENYLLVTYWGSDREEFCDGTTMKREFDIYADNVLITEESLDEDRQYSLFDRCYLFIPKEIIKEKSIIRIEFKSKEYSKVAGRVFCVRIISKKLVQKYIKLYMIYLRHI